MKMLTRRVLMWGGAAAVAGGGFAYMAGNTVDLTSAGQGAQTVSGYTVSSVAYSAEQGWGLPAPDYSVSTVKFTLTSAATTAPANARPAGINAALLGTSATTSTCSVSGWTINAVTGAGSGAVVCNFANPPLLSSITGLNVEANQ